MSHLEPPDRWEPPRPAELARLGGQRALPTALLLAGVLAAIVAIGVLGSGTGGPPAGLGGAVTFPPSPILPLPSSSTAGAASAQPTPPAPAVSSLPPEPTAPDQAFAIEVVEDGGPSSVTPLRPVDSAGADRYAVVIPYPERWYGEPPVLTLSHAGTGIELASLRLSLGDGSQPGFPSILEKGRIAVTERPADGPGGPCPDPSPGTFRYRVELDSTLAHPVALRVTVIVRPSEAVAWFPAVSCGPGP